MRNKKVILLAEMALAIALAVALGMLSVRLPINIAGGSISLAMLPIAVVALRRGPVAGAAVGCAFGMIDLIIQPFIVHWVQVFLDYPLPYAFFGAGVGLFSRAYGRHCRKEHAKTVDLAVMADTIVSVAVGGALRYSMHVLSGAIFFSENAPVGQNAWLYSFIYNITYLGPSLVATAAVMLIIMPVLNKAVPVALPPEKRS